jgi:hypothetical protein
MTAVIFKNYDSLIATYDSEHPKYVIVCDCLFCYFVTDYHFVSNGVSSFKCHCLVMLV